MGSPPAVKHSRADPRVAQSSAACHQGAPIRNNSKRAGDVMRRLDKCPEELAGGGGADVNCCDAAPWWGQLSSHGVMCVRFVLVAGVLRWWARCLDGGFVSRWSVPTLVTSCCGRFWDGACKPGWPRQVLLARSPPLSQAFFQSRLAEASRAATREQLLETC